jgi:hypothetical protein
MSGGSTGGTCFIGLCNRFDRARFMNIIIIDVVADAHAPVVAAALCTMTKQRTQSMGDVFEK